MANNLCEGGIPIGSTMAEKTSKEYVKIYFDFFQLQYSDSCIDRTGLFYSDLSVFFSVAELPYNDYFEYFGPDFKLHIQPSNMQNQNTPDYLDKIK